MARKLGTKRVHYMTYPTLTIGIPTCNGADTIQDTLESILSQIRSKAEGIEILISDNGSADNTALIVNKYIKIFPEVICYVKNERQELLLDSNIDNLFKNAKGEYVWIMSDDDALDDGAIDKVMSLIKKYSDISLIMVNYNEYDSTLTSVQPRIRDDIYKDIYCCNGDIFFRESKMLFGLISSLIIRKTDWLTINSEKYMGMLSIHIPMIMEILSNNKSYIVSDKLVKLRTGNCRWGHKGTFIFPILNILKSLKPMESFGYEAETNKRIVRHFYRNNLRSIIIANASGLERKKDALFEMINCYSHFLSFWILHVPLLMSPNFLFSVALKIYRKIK